MEFEQENIYLRKFNVRSLKVFDSFILVYYDCIRGMVTNFIRYLFKQIWFFAFQIKMKKKKANFIFEFQCLVILKIKNPLIFMVSVSTSV